MKCWDAFKGPCSYRPQPIILLSVSSIILTSHITHYPLNFFFKLLEMVRSHTPCINCPGYACRAASPHNSPITAFTVMLVVVSLISSNSGEFKCIHRKSR